MNITELAKELDGLARELRSLSSEAADAVTVSLKLGARTGATHARIKHVVDELTVREIAGAVAASKRTGGVRAVELRSDVYERRIEKLAPRFADSFEQAVRRGASGPTGLRVSQQFSRRPADVHYYGDVVAGFLDRTAVAADATAWFRAAHYVIARLVPGYGSNDFYANSRKLASGEFSRAYRLEERFREKLRDWLTVNTVLACGLDRAGKVNAILGADPAPFVAVLAQVTAGNADPLGIYATQPVAAVA